MTLARSEVRSKQPLFQKYFPLFNIVGSYNQKVTVYVLTPVEDEVRTERLHSLYRIRIVGGKVDIIQGVRGRQPLQGLCK
jgi:hypothetical protein